MSEHSIGRLDPERLKEERHNVDFGTIDRPRSSRSRTGQSAEGRPEPARADERADTASSITTLTLLEGFSAIYRR